jgi:hypothetical protein
MKKHFTSASSLSNNIARLNIIEPLWLVSEGTVRSKFPPPWRLRQQDVLQEEWYNIPLETVQKSYIYESFPSRAQTVLRAHGGPTSY